MAQPSDINWPGTRGSLIRHEVEQRIGEHYNGPRETALRMAIETIGRSEDGAGVITLAHAYFDFLTAAQPAR